MPTMQQQQIMEQQQVYVAIWAKAVETQMHFNEMSVKSRQFGLAFVTAALGLAIVLLSCGEAFSFQVSMFGGFDIHATVLIILASALALYAVSILDLNVYHKMLRGAVTFGEDFEQNYMRKIFDLNMGMTQAISHFSRFEDADKRTKDGKYEYTGKIKKDAGKKIRRFYNTAIFTLVISAAAMFLFTAHFGHSIQPPTPTASNQQAGAPTTPNSPIKVQTTPNSQAKTPTAPSSQPAADK